MSELILKTVKEINECKDAQREFCDSKRFPEFAPKSGTCYSCNRNIYQNYIIENKISNGEDGKRLITGCPHCFRSYCD